MEAVVDGGGGGREGTEEGGRRSTAGVERKRRRKENIWKESRSRNTSNPVIFKNGPFLYAFLQARKRN